jgi:hypothetical protein
MPVMSAVENDEAETAKRLTAALCSGQPLVSIDNVNAPLGGDFLCQAISNTTLVIRPFGKNTETMTIEARGTSIFMTGNNITLVGDVTRRAITATLDPNMERPELRVYKKNPKPVQTVLEDRGKYIAACLTICRAYAVAGRPNRAAPLASFEEWSDTVRSALLWLGRADCVESMKSARAEDPKRVQRLNLITAFVAVRGFGEAHKFTIAELIRLAKKTIAPHDITPLHPDLLDAVLAVAGRWNDVGEPAIDARVLGYWFRDNKNVIVENMRFTNKPDAKGGSQWWVEHLGGTTGERKFWDDRAEQATASMLAQAPGPLHEVPF